MVIKPGSAPTRAFNSLQRAALRILRRFGTDAHVYTAGANGAMVNLLQTGNYILSDGSTGYSAVDGPVGLVLDGAGSVGSELVTNGDFSAGATGWTVFQAGASTAVISGGSLTLTKADVTEPAAQTTLVTPVASGQTYLVTFDVTISSVTNGGVLYLAFPGGAYNPQTTSGAKSFYIVSNGSDTTLFKLSCGGGATATIAAVIDNISVKQVTGIHATQATTANKPTVRRGLLNLALYSQDITQWDTTAAGAITGGQSDPFGGTSAQLFSGANKNVYETAIKSGSVAAGTPVTHAIHCYSPTAGTITIGSANATAQSTININAGWGLYAFSWTSSLNDGPVLLLNGTLSAVTVYRQAFIRGTLTAAQILDSGGIPLTTSAAASNPSAGRYSWSFDGGDSLALGSVPFQMADDFAVIAAVNASATGTQAFYAQASTATANPLVELGTASGLPRFAFRDDAGTVSTPSGGASIANAPTVVSGRKVGSTKVVRSNGAQLAVDPTALGATTFNSASIGVRPVAAPVNFVSGNISIVIAIKGTLQDSEMLTLERFAASTLPNSPSF